VIRIRIWIQNFFLHQRRTVTIYLFFSSYFTLLSMLLHFYINISHRLPAIGVIYYIIVTCVCMCTDLSRLRLTAVNKTTLLYLSYRILCALKSFLSLPYCCACKQLRSQRSPQCLNWTALIKKCPFLYVGACSPWSAFYVLSWRSEAYRCHSRWLFYDYSQRAQAESLSQMWGFTHWCCPSVFCLFVCRLCRMKRVHCTQNRDFFKN